MSYQKKDWQAELKAADNISLVTVIAERCPANPSYIKYDSDKDLG